MQNENSQLIIKRFFQALRTLIEEKRIRGIKTFTDKYNINRWNFLEQEKYPSRDMFQVEWLHILCKDFGISPVWLLSGKGQMYTEGSIQVISDAIREQLSIGTFHVINDD